ncbi:MAG TPA: 23S rRNA (uracil(1939)-C(5))-methyltransferase RlmD [Candidatus Eisenbacteria bacterium]|nr:23S rRNA (uracil(1939)-C(5))-methyltransferase RlmD [Candidatus Eisenbacteria bacterium]
MSAPATAPKKNETIELEVESLALGGRGVAHREGFVVFVDDALPGDRVLARVFRRRERFAEARAVERLQSSPDRVDAPCVHYRSRTCGGCRFQDLDYARQLAVKQEQVKETLAHLGGFADPKIEPIVGSPERFRYRNKMEFSFHPGLEGEPLLGLHRRGRYDEVFALESCWLASELTERVVRHTQRFAAEHRWSAYHSVRHTGVVRFLVVRHLATSAQALVNLVAAPGEVPAAERWAQEIAALDPQIRGVVLNRNSSRANIAFGEPGQERVLAGEATIEERLHGLVFEAGANAFLQTNSRQAEALYAAALEEAEITGETRVLDLYCGAGTITLLAARQAHQALGFEMVGEAVRAAERNAAKNQVANVRFRLGEARRLLREWDEPWKPDVVIADPPRAGLHERVVDRIAGLGPQRVVYVSCNPATLARDLQGLAARGYVLERARPFDLFPHTPHIEVVARLTRASE